MLKVISAKTTENPFWDRHALEFRNEENAGNQISQMEL